MRKAEDRGVPVGYVEKHHIFPVSIFGKNKRIVYLTAREHFIAHVLLWKLTTKRYGTDHKRTIKMRSAAVMMCILRGKGQYRYCNSQTYKRLKEDYSKHTRGPMHHMYGCKRVLSAQHIENMCAARKRGADHPLYGVPRSDEVKQQISVANRGRRRSEEFRQARREKMLNMSEKTRQKLRESHLGQVAWNRNGGHIYYRITDPKGNTTETNNLSAYCEERGIMRGGLQKALTGKRKQYRGYGGEIITRTFKKRI